MFRILLVFLSSLLASSISAQTDTLFQTDFSPATTFDFESPTGAPWIVEDIGPGSASAFSMGAINSTSGGDFALFDSGAFGTLGTYQLSTVWIENYVDCSSYPYIYASFETYYKNLNGTCAIRVRYDPADPTVHGGYLVHSANNNVVYTTANPESKFIDISSYAAGYDSVIVGFQYTGYFSYAWMVDDLSIIGSDVPLIAGNENLVSLEKRFSIYPNPSEGAFTIDMTSFIGDVTLRVSHLDGRIISTEFVDQDLDSYDVFFEGISGVYVISATDETGESTMKIVKK